MNLNRILTTVIGLPIVIVILVFGNIYLIDVLFAIIAAMSIHEYFDSFKGKTNPVSWLGFVACGLIAFIHLIPKQYIIITIGILVPTSILILFLQVIISNMKTNVQDIAVTFFGICYIPLFLMYLPLLMGSENGKILIWFVIIAAWGTDIFAYIIGKKLGKHKFSRRLHRRYFRCNYYSFNLYILYKCMFENEYKLFVYNCNYIITKCSWSIRRFFSIKYKKICWN